MVWLRIVWKFGINFEKMINIVEKLNFGYFLIFYGK